LAGSVAVGLMLEFDVAGLSELEVVTALAFVPVAGFDEEGSAVVGQVLKAGLTLQVLQAVEVLEASEQVE
jgi:hypothetical protein